MRAQRIASACLGAALVTLLLLDSASGATYYVDPVNGNDANDGLATNTAWQTLDRTVYQFPWHLPGGSVVYLRGGEYRGNTNYISLSLGNSGTSESPTILTAYPGETPIICDSVTVAAFDLRYKNWWVLDGLTFSNNYRHCWLMELTNCVVKNCTFLGCNTNSDWQYGGVVLANDGSGNDGSMFNVFSNNTFKGWGWVTSKCNDHGVSLSLSGYSSDNRPHYYNLVVSNTFIGGAHDHLQLEAGYNVIRGNLFVNAPWIPTNETCHVIGSSGGVPEGPNPYGAWGNRHTKPGDGTAGEDWDAQFDMRNVFEDNRFLYTGSPPDDFGAFGIELGTSRSIYRRNVIAFSLAAGIFFNTSGTYSRSTSNAVYNNVIYGNGLANQYGGKGMQNYSTGVGTSNFETDPRRKDNFLVNNIIIRNLPVNVSALTAQYQQLRSNLTNDAVDPLFVSTNGWGWHYEPTDLPDFRLQSNSPCIDAGTWLAFVTSESGSGTTLAVDNSLYFSDGNKIVEGDRIQLQGQRNRAIVLVNDWTNNILYLDRPLTWTKGQGVSLAYSGRAPDMGAYEHRAAASSAIPPTMWTGWISIAATPNPVKRGESVTLTWECKDATNLTITGLGSVPLAGSTNLTPLSTTTYTGVGTSSSGKQVSNSHTVVVE